VVGGFQQNCRIELNQVVMGLNTMSETSEPSEIAKAKVGAKRVNNCY
jgi:hypothetical protein